MSEPQHIANRNEPADANQAQSGSPLFLDVSWLLDASQPRARVSWVGPGVAMFLLVVLGSALLSSRSPQMRSLVDAASLLAMVAIVSGMSLLMWSAVRRQRDERRMLESIEEFVQLRRWPEAAGALQRMLSQPTRTAYARVQALIFLSSVLARYNRFDDAIAVQTHLLENVNLDPPTAHALRLGRAMAMLREDHLFDADRAISELRRDVSRAAQSAQLASQSAESPVESGESDSAAPASPTSRANPGAPAIPASAAASSAGSTSAAPASSMPESAVSASAVHVAAVEPPVSAGLALIEMYRDVKTGHPDEAIAMFRKTLPALRRQLGHRVSDAYALVARAHDFLGRTDEAQSHWTQATLLSPVMELQRRYPELAVMLQKYRPAPAPTEAA